MFSIKKQLSLLLILFLLSTSMAFATDVSSLTSRQADIKSDIIMGLNQPYGIFVDAKGVVYIADSYNNMIKKITSEGLVLVAGGYDGKGTMGFPRGRLVDGNISEARFNRPRDLFVTSSGIIYVLDTGNNVIRKIENNTVSTISGTGAAGNKDGAANVTQFNMPSAIAMSTDGKLYVADTLNNSIRVVETNGTSTTLEFKADGKTLTSSLLNEPSDLIFSKDGTLYILDSGNQAVKKVKNGIISLVAGDMSDFNAETKYVNGALVNGLADKARFNFPKGFAMDDKGNIFIADSWNNSIRVITADGIVRTLAGSSFLGNKNGKYKDARFNLPTGMAIKGNKLIVSDMWNNEIKELAINYNSPAFGYSESSLKGMIDSSKASSAWTFWENGKLIALEKPIINKDSKTYMPFKATMEHYGYSISWDAINKRVLFTKGAETLFVDKGLGMVIFNNNSYMPSDKLAILIQKELYVLENERAVIGVDY